MQQRCAKRGSDQARELSAQFTAFKDSYDDMNFTAPYLSTIKAGPSSSTVTATSCFR